MRRFWFAVSMVLVFVLAATSSYIFLVMTDGREEIAEPAAEDSVLSPVGADVPTVAWDTEITVRESYDCGYESVRKMTGGEFAGQTFDALAAAGWAVARTGEGKVELARHLAGACPIEQECRLMRATERGVAVYAGRADHLGALLLEMPLNFAELPPVINADLQGGGLQLTSPDELDELLESLDELVVRE